MRKLSREEWLNGAFAVLCEGGIDALRVEPLAKRLGVTKGSFYHHFENRRALHMAIIAAWEKVGTTEIIDDVEGAATAPLDQIRRLAHQTMHVNPYSDAIETSIRSWAAHDDEVAEAIARVDERRVSFTAALLSSCGLPKALARRRARLLYRVLIGEFMWRTAGGPVMATKEIDEFVEMLIRPEDERLQS